MKFLPITLLLLATSITPLLALPQAGPVICKIVIKEHDKLLPTLQKPTTNFDGNREALLDKFLKTTEIIEKEKCKGVKELWPKLQCGDCEILEFRLEENTRWNSTCGDCPWLRGTIGMLKHVLDETGRKSEAVE